MSSGNFNRNHFLFLIQMLSLSAFLPVISGLSEMKVILNKVTFLPAKLFYIQMDIYSRLSSYLFISVKTLKGLASTYFLAESKTLFLFIYLFFELPEECLISGYLNIDMEFVHVANLIHYDELNEL